jgi:tRNA 2-thiouridine synthesizing protein A
VPRVLDLCGEVCPYTFLRSKLALEEMADGDELLIVLDHAPAYRSVPLALREDGHDVLAAAVSPDGSRCEVRARKRS